MREVASEQRAVIRRSGGAFATSIGAHVVIVAVLLALPRGWVQHEITGQIEIEIVEPTTVEVPPEPDPIEPMPEPLAPTAPQRAETTDPVRTPQGAVIQPTTGAIEPLGGGASIQMPTVGAEPPQGTEIDPTERQRIAALVAPGAAASSWVVAGAEGPSQPSGPAGLGATGGRPRIATEAEVEGQLSGHLRGTAMARPWLSRTEPTLVPRPDGSLEYRGHAFTARIAPDGAVTFSDRDAVQADEMLQGGPARFDLTDMAMRGAGQDPYAAEREWFMDHTEEVRARLETEARSRERDAALRGVPGRLAAIWNQERPAFLRRRAIFRMWDDCDEEGDGLNVRRQVMDFIRSEIPQNSPDAFTVEELRRLNGERDSTMEFDPY
ncbi:MAG: hypothetical protein K1X94_19585 [Sandaracinaceae bacterium]|nr:hypothetical protein [Sandaracinaceae bacterium]